MRSPAHLVRLVVLLSVTLAAVLGYSTSACAETVTFTPEDSGQTFEVPAGVYTIDAEAIGGQGGQAYEHYCHGERGHLEEVVKGESPGEGSEGEAPEAEWIPPECYGEAPIGHGGSGARVSATLEVSPGEKLLIHFGGGGEGSFDLTGPEADYNTYGAGGGGSELLDDTSSPLVVAGGGGGGGVGDGGNAEGFIGGDGGGEGAGKGATLSEGGAGGSCCLLSGEDGSRGRGGNGFVGGGGGGGYYGGGGAFFLGGGGGAGSSLIAPSATGTVGSGAGLAQQMVITYTVSPPTASITTPAEGATYLEGETVAAAYSCAEGEGGPGLEPGSEGCSGPVADGNDLDTSTSGKHEFTVTATSKDGLTETVSTGYTVVVARCTANSGTVTLSPGLTGTPAIQRMRIKGTLTGCAGRPITSATYTATLETTGPVACSVLKAAGEPATGTAKYVWTPKAKASKGSLDVLLAETSGIMLSGELASGPYSPLSLSGIVAESYTNAATCGVPQGRRGIVKKVTRGTFSGSALDFE